MEVKNITVKRKLALMFMPLEKNLDRNKFSVY